MKGMVPGFVLALAALALMTSPALAAPDSPLAAPVLSAADQEFLVSLATPAPVLAAGGPIAEKALCTATVDCGMTSLTCSSSVNGASCSSVDRRCPIQRGSVTCDGLTAMCPICPITQSS